jgi:hypothetical protein
MDEVNEGNFRQFFHRIANHLQGFRVRKFYNRILDDEDGLIGIRN